MRSCSSLLCSGVVMETSSTLVNWCWRIMPRVSLPAAPASARKHGVQAVSRIGSAASSTMDSRTRLVSGTSAVGMSQKSSLSGARSKHSINQRLQIDRLPRSKLFLIASTAYLSASCSNSVRVIVRVARN